MVVDRLTARRGSPAVVLAAAVVALQIGYPLASGSGRDRLTVGIVLAFAAASTTHAIATRGVQRGGRAVALAVLIGFGAEVVGVHTGVPFGDYRYGESLGVRLFGVPVLVALAWAMVAWPAAIVARRLVAGRVARVLVGAWALAAWDLYLDPQMVAAGAWRWDVPSPHLPGVTGVPVSNYAGWLAVSLVVSAAIQWVLAGDRPRADLVPVALYVWTWIGSAVALAAFLHRPAAAAWGAAGMGVVAVPLLRTMRR